MTHDAHAPTLLGLMALLLYLTVLFVAGCAPDVGFARAVLWPLVVARFLLVHGTAAVYSGARDVVREAVGIVRRG